MFPLTVKNRSEKILLTDIPALRQAFFVGAIFIIGGVVLAITVHQYFLALPLMVSVGLLLSATLGVCPMAAILDKMPWNR